jgi:hypothetical protein
LSLVIILATPALTEDCIASADFAAETLIVDPEAAMMP